MSYLPELDLAAGVATVHHADTDSHWIIACAFHRGEAVVEVESRVDPETGAPRKAQNVTRRGSEVLITEDDATFPIYSDDTGHDPDCVACRQLVLDVKSSIAQQMISRELAHEETIKAIVELRRLADTGEPAAVDALRRIEADGIRREERR